MGLKKYLRIFLSFFKASFVADLEYRANFLVRILTDIFWYLAQITTFEVIYRHTDKLGDWNIHQTRVFIGLLFVADAIYMVLFHDNLDHMSDKVRKGDLDLLLVKPVNSQFMISFQRIATALFGNLLIGSMWLAWALSQLPNFSWLKTLWLLLLIPCGIVALYSTRFIVSTTTLIFTKSDNLQYLWFQVYKLGMRPDSIYFPWLKVIILSLFPVAFVASVPARALLDEPNIPLFIWAPFWSLVTLYASHRFWNYSLKHYSSASS